MIVGRSELNKLYWVDNKNLKQIARLYGVSDVTVMRWMNKHRIARRDRMAAARLRMSSPEVRRHLSMKLRKKFTPRPGPTLAYVLGVLLGDGSVYRSRSARGSYSYHVSLYVKDKTFAEKFANALTEIELDPRVYVCKNGFYRVEAINGGFYEWYKSLDLNHISSLVREFEDRLVCGFYESEGSIDTVEKRRRLRIRMGNKQRELLLMVQNILCNWGIKSWLCKTTYPGYFTLHVVGNNRVKRFLHIVKPCIKVEPRMPVNTPDCFQNPRALTKPPH